MNLPPINMISQQELCDHMSLQEHRQHLIQ